MPERFYDELGAGYDTIIDWDGRLAREAPFLARRFDEHSVRSVLDTACGTGEHAALFSSWGLDVVATDISQEMLEVCRRKYRNHPMTCLRAGFGTTYDVLGRSFEAVTCLGNSWPHLLTDREAERAARDFARLVEPGGIVVLQQLNYEAMRRRGERFMGPESRTVDGGETLFLRIFDLDRDPIRFTIVRMAREGEGWRREGYVTEHRAWTAPELERVLREARFASLRFYGSFAEDAFDPATSDQLIAVAVRAQHDR